MADPQAKAPADARRPRLAVGAADGHGRFGQLSTVWQPAQPSSGGGRYRGEDVHGGLAQDDDDLGQVLLVCHECGRTCANLGVHAVRAHQLPAGAYRTRHGLPRTVALVAPATRAAMAAGWARHGEEHTERLKAMAEAHGERARSAAHPVQVRAGWAPGRMAAAQARMAAAGHLGFASSPSSPSGSASARRRAATLAGVDPAWRAALVAELGDPADVAAWAARARVVLAREGLTQVALSRLCGLADSTTGMRLARSARTAGPPASTG